MNFSALLRMFGQFLITELEMNGQFKLGAMSIGVTSQKGTPAVSISVALPVATLPQELTVS